MRSIFVKITLAFVLVSLVGAVLAALIIQQRTRSAFDRFLIDQNRESVLDALAQHFQNHGSWAGVEAVFTKNIPGENPNPGVPPQGDERRGAFDPFRSPFVVVDLEGQIVFGRADWLEQPVPPEELADGNPIEVDGQIVGWLLPARTPPEWEHNTPQGIFLKTVNRAILFGAIGAFVLALLLGGVLARSLTSPLRELAGATKILAKGELGYTVRVRSRDEIGQLADSFNQMSTDLAKSNQLRKQMTADIAHDLRTPLSILMGYTEALSDGKLPGSPETHTTMHQVAQHLSHLVDDLRTISLADAGDLPIHLLEMPPGALLERTAAAYASQASEKNIALRVAAAPDLPQITADPERMAQVLGNLVSNALRYTPEGGWIELSTAGEQSAVCIQVSDNGSGIAPEDLPNIFTRFYRADRSRQNNGETGLGLTIAKSLVEAQGGTISVESELGQGTRFTIRMAFPA